MQMLPPEIMTMIFQYVRVFREIRRILLTCRQWYDIMSQIEYYRDHKKFYRLSVKYPDVVPAFNYAILMKKLDRFNDIDIGLVNYSFSRKVSNRQFYIRGTYSSLITFTICLHKWTIDIERSIYHHDGIWVFSNHCRSYSSICDIIDRDYNEDSDLKKIMRAFWDHKYELLHN